MFLKSEGFDVQVASSMKEALQFVRAAPRIDLLITDYHLEDGCTGLDVVAACRELPGAAGLPAILLSGDTSRAIRAIAGDASLRVASKPIDPDQLLEVMAEVRRRDRIGTE
jgi:CheY-like chemotaxis protein